MFLIAAKPPANIFRAADHVGGGGAGCAENPASQE